jgi:hypothetical protein
MPTIAEIVLKYRDEFSDKAKRDLVEFERSAKRTMGSAKDSADILKDTLGIQLPRELTKLVAQSKLIGPALATSFNVVALIGFIGALRQVPEMFKQISEAITGWDEKSKKAYENFLSDNKKAIDRVVELKAKLAELSTVSLDPQAAGRAGIESRLKDAVADLVAAQRSRTDAQNAINALSSNTFVAGGQGQGPAKSIAELRDDVERFGNAAVAAAAKVTALQDDLRKLETQAAATAVKGVNALRLSLSMAMNTSIPFAPGLPPRPLIAPEFDPMTGTLRTLPTLPNGQLDPFAEMKFQHERAVQGIIGSSSIPLNAQANVFRSPSSRLAALSPVEILNGRARFPSLLPSGEVDPFAELKFQALRQRQEELARTMSDAFGRTWDTFTQRGITALERLANFANMLFDSIGRTLFQQFGMGLVTGRASSGGGLLGSVSGLGAGLGAKAGLPALFGGLTGIGSATAGASVPLAAVQAGWVPSIPLGAGGAAAGGGLSGALGLGGGSGLLGLGAATIPVIGGAILGGFLLGKALFGRKTIEAPFTQDPNAIERNRSIFFFTGMTDAMDRFSRAVDRFTTMPPGLVVAEGLPAALESSNQFRRGVASTLMGDEL